MNDIKIPTAVTIFGSRFPVVFNPKLQHKENARGMAYHREERIELLEATEHFPVSQQQIEQTFLHELMHIILNELNEYELRDNEKFVDLMASALHQAFKQAEYGETDS